MDVGQDRAAVGGDSLQRVTARDERGVDMVGTRGGFKTRHAFTPEELELRSVRVVLVVEKRDHGGMKLAEFKVCAGRCSAALPPPT